MAAPLRDCRVDAYDGPVNDRRYIGERLTPLAAVAIARDAAAAFARLVDQVGLDKNSKPNPVTNPAEQPEGDDLARLRAKRTARHGGAGA